MPRFSGVVAKLLLICSMMSLSSAGFAARSDFCGFEENHKIGILSVTLIDGRSPGRYRMEYEMPDYVSSDKGELFRFGLLGYFSGDDYSKAAQARILDNIIVTFNLDVGVKPAGPAHLMLTRDGTIAFDIAPGKIWYPDYDGPLEFAVSLGDLQRQMDFGPDEPPVKELSWALVNIGDSVQNSTLVVAGDIPLAPVWAAKDRAVTALERWAKGDRSAGC